MFELFGNTRRHLVLAEGPEPAIAAVEAVRSGKRANQDMACPDSGTFRVRRQRFSRWPLRAVLANRPLGQRSDARRKLPLMPLQAQGHKHRPILPRNLVGANRGLGMVGTKSPAKE